MGNWFSHFFDPRGIPLKPNTGYVEQTDLNGKPKPRYIVPKFMQDSNFTTKQNATLKKEPTKGNSVTDSPLSKNKSSFESTSTGQYVKVNDSADKTPYYPPSIDAFQKFKSTGKGTPVKDTIDKANSEPIGKKPIQSVPLTLGKPAVPGTPRPILTPEQRREGLRRAFTPIVTNPDLKPPSYFNITDTSPENITAIQQELVTKGFGHLLGEVDGVYGPNTQAALEAAIATKKEEPRYSMDRISTLSANLVPTATPNKLATNWLPADYKKKGGNIEINPKNKGKFTATKKETGKTTEELTHSKNPVTKKRAIFAQNAKKWKHQKGGKIEFDLSNILDTWKK